MNNLAMAITILAASIIISLGNRYEFTKLNDEGGIRTNKFSGEICYLSPGKSYVLMTCDVKNIGD